MNLLTSPGSPTTSTPTSTSFVLRRTYIEGELYRGGHGPALVRLLHKLAAKGLCFRNFFPDNIIVAKRSSKVTPRSSCKTKSSNDHVVDHHIISKAPAVPAEDFPPSALLEEVEEAVVAGALLLLAAPPPAPSSNPKVVGNCEE